MNPTSLQTRGGQVSRLAQELSCATTLRVIRSNDDSGWGHKALSNNQDSSVVCILHEWRINKVNHELLSVDDSQQGQAAS